MIYRNNRVAKHIDKTPHITTTQNMMLLRA